MGVCGHYTEAPVPVLAELGGEGIITAVEVLHIVDIIAVHLAASAVHDTFVTPLVALARLSRESCKCTFLPIAQRRSVNLIEIIAVNTFE